MKESFIAKFETNSYYIGSFDSYIEKSIELLMIIKKQNNNIYK